MANIQPDNSADDRLSHTVQRESNLWRLFVVVGEYETGLDTMHHNSFIASTRIRQL